MSCVKCNKRKNYPSNICDCDCHLGEPSCDIVIQFKTTPEKLEDLGIPTNMYEQFAGFVGSALSEPNDKILKSEYVDDIMELLSSGFLEIQKMRNK